VTVRRALLATASLLAVVAIVFGVKPFRVRPSITAAERLAPSGAILVSTQSCRAPILDAWRGKQQRWAVTIAGTSTGAPLPDDLGYVNVASCRGVARHKLLIAVIALLAASMIAWYAWFGRRPAAATDQNP
jgi:hypothetical protein